jgi:hypothetical protein
MQGAAEIAKCAFADGRQPAINHEAAPFIENKRYRANPPAATTW